MHFPPASFVHQIAKQMRDQLQGYYLHPATAPPSTAGKGTNLLFGLPGVDPPASVKSEQIDVDLQSSNVADNLKEDANASSLEELRILIKVNCWLFLNCVFVIIARVY